jgi:hypothetical protein
VVGASIQYMANRGTRDERLQSSSASTRNAILHALDNIQMPPNFSKVDLVTTFYEIFRVILLDTPNLGQWNLSKCQVDESEMDALHTLCVRLNNRQVVHRVSDREVTYSISEITRNIALLDDPSGQFRAPHPRLYAINCKKCHLAGDSQLRHLQNFELPVRPELYEEPPCYPF